VEAVKYDGDVLGEYLQMQWRENLGIKITWQTIEFAAFLDRLLTGEVAHMWISRWIADYADPDSFLRACPIELRSRWPNEAYHRLVEQGRRMMDQERRMDLYRRADRILVQEAAIVPLVYGRYHFLVKPWVKRYPGPWKDVIIEPH
jgi:ABC-type oligopeptide transport system substrate-binding subunit